MRIILLFLVLITVFWLIKRLFFQSKQQDIHVRVKQNLVQCHYCKTHIPQSLSVQQDGQFYCNQNHADLD